MVFYPLAYVIQNSKSFTLSSIFIRKWIQKGLFANVNTIYKQLTSSRKIDVLLATFSQEQEICTKFAFVHILFYTVCSDKLVVPNSNMGTDSLQIDEAYGVVDRTKKKTKQKCSGIILIK